jgi:hypothetical protein
MELRFGTAMAHGTEQAGVDCGQPCQRTGIQPIILPTTLADQSHVTRVGHNHFVTQLGQLPADPG